MPSERSRGQRLAQLLRSQGLGVACGIATVLLLAVGSFVIPATRDGASAGLMMDELRPFVDRPSVWHSWFYLLMPVFGLYAVNTLLATWHSVVGKWRSGVRTPFRYGAAVMHVAFVVALFAHLIGGFYGAERGAVVARSSWQPIGDGRDIRLVDLDVASYPNGQPRAVTAHVELRGADGEVERRAAGYNHPISDGWGARLLLLTRWDDSPPAVLVALGAARCRLAVGESCALGPLRAVLREVKTVPGSETLVPVLALAQPGEPPREVWLPPQGAQLPEGQLVAQPISSGPAVLFRYRYAPGSPWALAASLLLVAGIVLLGRRWWS